jgi:hypothetical protein
VLKRAGDEGRGQAGPAGGGQVGLVRRGQHDLTGLEPEQRGWPQVRLRIRLVRPRHVGAEDQVPRQAAGLCHVKQQRRVPVGQRPHDVAALDRRDPGHAVGPRWQEVPGAGQPVQFMGVKGARVEPQPAEHIIEVLPVQYVQGDEGPLARTHPPHRRLVLAPPGVGERVGIKFQAVPAGE